MRGEMVLTGARVVTRREVFAGTVRVIDGLIAAVDRGRSAVPGAEDLDGDYLVPGLVELHSDGLERYLVPRPGVRWPGVAAAVAHDAECAAAGITTVFDALTVSGAGEGSPRAGPLRDTAGAVAQAAQRALLRPSTSSTSSATRAAGGTPTWLVLWGEDPLVRLVSITARAPAPGARGGDPCPGHLPGGPGPRRWDRRAAARGDVRARRARGCRRGSRSQPRCDYPTPQNFVDSTRRN